MIGQERNKDTIFRWKLNRSIPRFIIINGVRGSGRLTLAKYIVNELNATGVISGNKVDEVKETLDNAYRVTTPTVYIFRDVYGMTVNAKNALLKAVEEPPNKAYFIVTTESLSDIPDTIVSRGTVIHMSPYSPDELSQVTEDKLLLKYFRTIGEIEAYKDLDYKNLISEAETLVFDALSSFVSQSGTKLLCATSKLRSKESEEDKIDCNLFMTIFMSQITNYVLPISTLNIMNGYIRLYRNKSVNKKPLIESMLIAMLRDVREHGYEIIAT